jgi:hypothetical protein
LPERNGRIVIDELKRNDHGAAVSMLCTRWKNDSLRKLAIGILKRFWLDDDELEALIAELRGLYQQRDTAIGSCGKRHPKPLLSGTGFGSRQTDGDSRHDVAACVFQTDAQRNHDAGQ